MPVPEDCSPSELSSNHGNLSQIETVDDIVEKERPMIIKPTTAFLIWKSKQIETPTYKNGIWIIFRQINQFTKKISLELILGCPIHGDEGPCELLALLRIWSLT